VLTYFNNIHLVHMWWQRKKRLFFCQCHVCFTVLNLLNYIQLHVTKLLSHVAGMIIQELDSSSYGLSMMQTVAGRATRQRLQVPPLCPPSVQHSEIGECTRACRSRYCHIIHTEIAVTTRDVWNYVMTE